jgi:hypothetical protein
MKRMPLASMVGGGALVLAAAVALLGSASANTPASTSAVAGPAITVYKSATCGCCALWVKHLEEAGFDVTVMETEALQAIKVEHGVGDHLASCHTALIDGYVVEGHVPADDITSMLASRPDIVGLAVPGMIIGTPGMEIAGQPAQPYQVLAFDREGRTTVYANR